MAPALAVSHGPLLQAELERRCGPGRAWRGSHRTEAGVVADWAGKSPDGALRPAWTALPVARLDRRWITGLADRDRERLQAGRPGHGRLVIAAGERDLEEPPATGHAHKETGPTIFVSRIRGSPEGMTISNCSC